MWAQTAARRTVPSEELLFLPDVEQWTLNTPMACTPLPAAAGFSPRYSAGVMPHLDEVLQQWRDARGVNPLRVVLAGAPMAGARRCGGSRASNGSPSQWACPGGIPWAHRQA